MLRRKIFRNWRHSKKLKDRETCYTLILAVGIYIGTILWIYLQDLPRFGGTNRTCKRFHYIPPESTKSNSTYPFPNTFNRVGEITPYGHWFHTVDKSSIRFCSKCTIFSKKWSIFRLISIEISIKLSKTIRLSSF